MIDDADHTAAHTAAHTADRLMNDEAVEDAVLEYLNEIPHPVQGIAPTRDLWPGIESRISARVLPLGEATASTTASRARLHHARPRWTSWVPMAAAAAVLISASASVTYVLTKHGDTTIPPSNAPTTIAANPVSASVPVTLPAGVPVDVSRREVAASAAQKEHQSSLQKAAPPSAQLVSHRDDQGDIGADTRAIYDEEITTLRSAVEARRSQLDPATVKTIEQNLRVIDNAIAQSRAALAKDPKSQFLSSQLDRSLAKETDLLRAAALLPST